MKKLIIINYNYYYKLGMNELHIDIKKHLDESLKSSCQSLKYSTIQYILGPLESFLAKVVAFIGCEIPVYRGQSNQDIDDNNSDKNQQEYNGQDAFIPATLRETLKKQQFIKPERIQSLLKNVLEIYNETKPTFISLLKVYIENSITRTVILKPILQELTMMKLRMVNFFLIIFNLTFNI